MALEAILGRQMSVDSVRVQLCRLHTAGRVERIAAGVYCLKGANAVPFTFVDWLAEEIAGAWPNACTLRSLKARYRETHRRQITEDFIALCLVALESRNQVDATGSGAYIWKRAMPS